MKHISVGDVVTPLTKAGLWLVDVSINGEYQQKRNNVCVFKGIGKIIDICTCVINYDEWDNISTSLNEDYDPYNIGKIEYTDYLIQCSDGVGWGGGVTKA